MENKVAWVRTQMENTHGYRYIYYNNLVCMNLWGPFFEEEEDGDEKISKFDTWQWQVPLFLG